MSDLPQGLQGRRLAVAALGAVHFTLLAIFSRVAERYEEIFRQLEMKHLPAPTELFLAFAGFARTPVGLVVWIAAGLAFSGLALRGTFDAHLKRLTIVLVLALLLVPAFFVLAVYLPIIKIQQSLSR